MRTGKLTLAHAKTLRLGMSVPEIRLWLRLRTPGDGCPRFRRQHPLGPYVLDFYCAAAKLAVEIDGWGHNQGDQPARDQSRDQYLAAQGLSVLRIPAAEVLADPDAVADQIMRQAIGMIA